MKNLFILTLSLLFWTYNIKPSIPQTNYIEIVGMGVQDAIPEQSFIVINKLDLKMVREKMGLSNHPNITDEKLRYSGIGFTIP